MSMTVRIAMQGMTELEILLTALREMGVEVNHLGTRPAALHQVSGLQEVLEGGTFAGAFEPLPDQFQGPAVTPWAPHHQGQVIKQEAG